MAWQTLDISLVKLTAQKRRDFRSKGENGSGANGHGEAGRVGGEAHHTRGGQRNDVPASECPLSFKSRIF